MQIQINTDRNIEGREALAERVRSEVEDALDRYRGQISRVEVHLSDENADKSGQRDMRCMIEVRLEGRQPIAVTEEAASMAQAGARRHRQADPPDRDPARPRRAVGPVAGQACLRLTALRRRVVTRLR